MISNHIVSALDRMESRIIELLVLLVILVLAVIVLAIALIFACAEIESLNNIINTLS